MDYLKQIGMWLAVKLDGLKSQPVLFLIIQALLSALALAFANDYINIPTPEIVARFLNLFLIPDLDTVFTVLLATIVALSGSRCDSFFINTIHIRLY